MRNIAANAKNNETFTEIQLNMVYDVDVQTINDTISKLDNLLQDTKNEQLQALIRNYQQTLKNRIVQIEQGQSRGGRRSRRSRRSHRKSQRTRSRR